MIHVLINCYETERLLVTTVDVCSLDDKREERDGAV